ncbi:glycosyltransferase [Kamptonema cortianum]|nr:glycosyltransferase [Oscillatoria laete-virens]MDK3156456.1 glycosyltransferase [Kamptonema cortianum]MDL5053862.1 glycosyltransferase [Oscillatoria laete-virens NRMC-F 0139]
MTKQLTIIHTESSPNWGGQEQRVFAEMLEMRRRGHRLMVVTVANCPLARKCGEAGMPVVAMVFKNQFFLGNLLRLATLFHREKADVINPHSSKDGWLAVLAGRLAGVPCIIRSRHIEVDYPKKAISQYAFRKLPHHVITTSERIRSRMIAELDVPADRIETVATGIDFEKFSSGDRSKLRGQIALDEGTPLVGMISVLRSWKGHRYFLEAARELLDAGANLHFIIAGDGPQKKDITEQIARLKLEGCIHLLGHRDDIPDVLAALDVLALPSTGGEGIPQIILQAHGMGIPVVATRAGGIPEVVQEGMTGRLVDPADAGQLARAIRETLDNREASQTMARRAAQFVRTHHSIKVMGNKIEEIYARHVPGYRPILL